VIAVVPNIGSELIKELRFRSDHNIINLMATVSLSTIANSIGETQSLTHVVPLPFIALGVGPIVIYPENKEVDALFSPLGKTITVQTEQQVSVLQSITALMSPYYRLLDEITQWGLAEGLSYESTMSYVATFFEAMSHKAKVSSVGLNDLANEYTPGGINEAALKKLEAGGVYAAFSETLTQVLERVYHAKSLP